MNLASIFHRILLVLLIIAFSTSYLDAAVVVSLLRGRNQGMQTAPCCCCANGSGKCCCEEKNARCGNSTCSIMRAGCRPGTPVLVPQLVKDFSVKSIRATISEIPANREWTSTDDHTPCRIAACAIFHPPKP